MSESALLAQFTTTLDEVIDLLTAHGEQAVLPGLRSLRAQADDDAAPADTLARVDRSYWSLMTIPDGFSALYLTQAGGGVDRDATDRLTALRNRLTALLAQARDEGAPA